MNPWGAIIGAALGGMKAQGEEKAAHREREIEALKTRWAAFTGQGFGRNVGLVDHMGRVMQGAVAGGMMGTAGAQGLDKGGQGQTTGVDPGAGGNAYAGGAPSYQSGGSMNKYRGNYITQ